MHIEQKRFYVNSFKKVMGLIYHEVQNRNTENLNNLRFDEFLLQSSIFQRA